MNIWRFKPLLVGLAVFLTAGCDEIATGGLVAPAQSKAVQHARMVGGAVTLVAPLGFCIDRAALRAQFALLARCDALGAQATNEDAPIGVISVSIAPAGPTTALPSPEQIATVSGLGTPLDAQNSAKLTLFRAMGEAPAEGMSQTQWRAAAFVGEYLLGVALYGPEGGRAVSHEGAGLVKELVRRTQASSEQQ